nr:hypothetical protein [Tanacetum cinerariifolium]
YGPIQFDSYPKSYEGVSDPDPLSVSDPPSRHPADVAHPAGGNRVTTALEIRTGGKAAEEVRCSGGTPEEKDSGPRARNKKPGSVTGG